MERWEKLFDELSVRVSGVFGDTQEVFGKKLITLGNRAVGYLQGLLSRAERKNGWQISEELGEKVPYKMQHFLGRADWDSDKLRDELQQYVKEYLGDGRGTVFVLDETGILKKGTKSACVNRQYSGTAGRIENCQIGVFLTLANSMGATLIDRRLYMPEVWAKDKQRREEAKIPESVDFRKKPQLAQDMLETAQRNGISAEWVTADEVYGGNYELRRWLELRNQKYVMACSVSQPVCVELEKTTISKLFERSEIQWERISCGSGTKGERIYDWQMIPINGADTGLLRRFALARRNIRDSEDVAYYLVYAEADVAIDIIVKVAGMRWTVESNFQSSKGEVGLDQYEVRSWHGWHRHMTLCLWAHAFLVKVAVEEAQRTTAQKKMPKRTRSRRRNSMRAFKASRRLSDTLYKRSVSSSAS